MSSRANSSQPTPNPQPEAQTRTYMRSQSAVFSKTKEDFGGLSNMAAGFPIRVNNVRILTSEALYQACRFPHLPQVQRLIIDQLSPMTAKMKSKPYRKDSRPDWDRVRVKVMRWCLRVKLAQNWSDFSRLLLSTGDRPIVEESRKDDFWGAKVLGTDTDTLVGTNALGRLLMELREQVKHGSRDHLGRVEPLPIADFLLFGDPIGVVEARAPKLGVSSLDRDPTATRAPYQPRPSTVVPGTERPMPFGTSVNQEKGKPLVEALKPYPEYKESRQAWLGLLPRHWIVLPNRALFAEVNDRDHSDEEMLSITITKGIIKQKALLTGSSKKDSSKEDKSAYKLVQPRDIAYNKMRAWQGAVGASELRGIISPAYIVMRPRDENNVPRYFHHLYRTPQFAKEAERWSYGITSDMWSLRPEHFKMIYTPQPPPAEQAAIVRFLEWANGRLERAIRAKRKVIALLNEQRQAIIRRAVTRGLDPFVLLKPSGIPWLGDIPAHWDTRKVKFLVTTVGGMTPNKGIARFWEGRIPWVSPKDMKRREIGDSQDHISEAALRETNIALIPPPAVLIVVRGMILARTFPTAVTTAPVTINQDMKALSPKPALDADFFVSLLTGIQRDLLNLVEESGHGTRCLRTDSWANFSVPLPPVPEQVRINEQLRSELAGLNSAVSRLEREIDLLREYRNRLVADVVTGKLDVREGATQLPEEVAPTTEVETDLTTDPEVADEESVV
jgi:type I restriction enzyme S subunit